MNNLHSLHSGQEKSGKKVSSKSKENESKHLNAICPYMKERKNSKK